MTGIHHGFPKVPGWLLADPASSFAALPTTAAAYIAATPGASYSLCGGTWPVGVTINPTTGVLSGTGAPGTYTGLKFCLSLGGQVILSTTPFTLILPVTTQRVVSLSRTTPYGRYSDDAGVSWASFPTVSPNSLTRLAITNGTIYVAAAILGIYSSSDGLTWTLRQSVVGLPSNGSNGVDQVIWNGTQFLALSSVNSGSFSFRTFTSTDGITWVEGSIAISSGESNGYGHWNPVLGLFCIGLTGPGGTTFWTSPTGLTGSWTFRISFATVYATNTVKAGRSLWVTFTLTPAADIIYTDDFVSWFSANSTLTASSPADHPLATAGGKFMLLAVDGKVSNSVNGSSWTAGPDMPALGGYWVGLRQASTGRLIAGGSHFATSDDEGATWTSRGLAVLDTATLIPAF